MDRKEIYDMNGMLIGYTERGIGDTTNVYNLRGDNILMNEHDPFASHDICSYQGQLGWMHEDVYQDPPDFDTTPDW